VGPPVGPFSAPELAHITIADAAKRRDLTVLMHPVCNMCQKSVTKGELRRRSSNYPAGMQDPVEGGGTPSKQNMLIIVISPVIDDY
jgi:hypothetical protein